MSAADVIAQHIAGLVALSTFETQLIEAYRRLSTEDLRQLGEHDTALQEHLEAGASPPIPSATLRRIACLVPGAMRGLPNWLSCLDDNRGGFSPRRLQESAGWLERIAKPLHVARWLSEERHEKLAIAAQGQRLPAHDIATMADDQLLEYLASLPKPSTRPRANSLARTYGDLSGQDVAAIVAFAIELLDAFDWAQADVVFDLLLPLATLHPEGLQDAHGALVDRSIYYPGELYRGADSATN